MIMDLEKYRYPIGRFDAKQAFTSAKRNERIDRIRRFPSDLLSIVKDLDATQLNTPYRPNGWTVAQLVHHLADSHLNSYIRFRWALTEDSPLIKAYDQRKWAELGDAKSSDISPSIQILEGVHHRWVKLLSHLKPEDFKSQLSHPEWSDKLDLEMMLALYTWHCDHHLAHIQELIKREGW